MSLGRALANFAISENTLALPADLQYFTLISNSIDCINGIDYYKLIESVIATLVIYYNIYI